MAVSLVLSEKISVVVSAVSVQILATIAVNGTTVVAAEKVFVLQVRRNPAGIATVAVVAEPSVKNVLAKTTALGEAGRTQERRCAAGVLRLKIAIQVLETLGMAKNGVRFLHAAGLATVLVKTAAL